jgi:SAM-dependent methyltransferase
VIDHNNLEEFADPSAYDAQDSSDTGVVFYAGLAKQAGGNVLELACGTGRVGIPIAKQGFSVTGLDVVPGMLDVARQKSEGLTARWLAGDARTFELNEQFSLIFITGNSFQAFLTRHDQETFLERVHKHLADGGLFAFETRNPRSGNAAQPDEHPPFGFAYLQTNLQERQWPAYTDQHGREVRLSKTQTYDHNSQTLHWTTYRRWEERKKERVKITRIALRYTFPQELEALLHHNGFDIQAQYGDWNGDPLTETSNCIITVCTKKLSV